MRVRFLKDWQGDGSASFKKDQLVEIDNLDLAWDLAAEGVVKFLKDVDPEIEKAKKLFKLNKKAKNGRMDK